ncbi:Atrial natriuretic peptide receptor 1 [Exaiptasia diaphana]|nr:Atrial natriuretic peptide receptor 1 [Exaiptasia diaphana]
MEKEEEKEIQKITASTLIQPKKKISRRLRISNGLFWSRRAVQPLSNSSASLRSCEYNAASRCQRHWLTVKILSVSLFSVVVLLILLSMDVNSALTLVTKERALQESVGVSIKVAELIHNLQVERGLTVLYISSGRNASRVGALKKARAKTSTSITKVPSWPDEVPSHIFRSQEAFTQEIESHREVVDNSQNSTIESEIKYYTNIIDMSLNWLFQSVMKNTLNERIFDLLGYYQFLVAKDKTGIERALGGSFFARGYFNDTKDLLWYAEQKLIGDAFLNSSKDLMKFLNDEYNDLVSKKAEVMNELKVKRSIIFENKPAKGNGTAGQVWFDLITEYMEVLFEVQSKTSLNVSGSLEKDVERRETTLIISSAILVLVLALTPIMVVAVVRMTSTIQKYAAQLESTTKNLIEEQKRTDSVLSAMFPKTVAETLKKGERVNAEYFDSVTVYFSDIVNFTNICSMISPMQVTSMLNSIYSAFDDTIDKFDVYKVETIGDAYMVVSGLPIKNGNNHVDQICQMAFDLLQLAKNFKIAEVPGEALVIRVGVHTGPCVSGIVGVKMPRYCLFGDTVNTASRMESTGLPQKIHISETTKQLLKYFDKYEVEHRGHIEVKGKGQMQTYWLNGCGRPCSPDELSALELTETDFDSTISLPGKAR